MPADGKTIILCSYGSLTVLNENSSGNWTASLRQKPQTIMPWKRRDFYKVQNFDEISTNWTKQTLAPYRSARKCEGSRYSKSSLMGIRHGIARYLKQDGFENYARWSVFFGQRSIFRCNFRTEKAWKAKLKHHPEITQTGLQKLYNSFEITQPKDLLYNCLFDIVFFLVLKGPRKLSRRYVAVDSQSRKYAYQKIDELGKNHHFSHDTSFDVRKASKCTVSCEMLWTLFIKV